MRKYLFIVFYAVSNSNGYERHSFDLDESNYETFKKILVMDSEECRIYCMDNDLQMHQDLREFVYDYNDELLDGGWWCTYLYLSKEEVTRAWNEII